MPGIVAPESFPIRDPRDPKQVVGRIVNPVRYMTMGGLDAPGKWKGNDKVPANDMRVEKPTSVRAARNSTHKNED